ncbi:hypothetical protein GCM10023216_23680 [Isoptericola chiayiensis]|uniref:DUF559 domain-containing protein n=1 Tax=Isoptericola chiayiensis TaxID=579446 RepID=A0ABP8YLV5_9MICO|nr:type IV toxin-antitoxin system AbiEi family antitoxin domain-containing protein [Isoptericola chiayiensis]NOV99689.1 hypothetical protein [Isoptericola chiayiensis]
MPARFGPVPPALLRLAERQYGLLTVAQCLASGMTRGQVQARCQAKDWERPVRGVVDLGLPSRHDRLDRFDLRRHRAAVLGLLAHPGSVATGVCALVLHGVQGAPIEIAPEVALPTGVPRVAKPPVRLRRSPVTEWVDVGGFRCAPVDVAMAQAVLASSRRSAVSLMDSALHRGLLAPDGLERVRGKAAGRPGVVRTRRWWALADGRAESPAETWARLSCLDAGWPPDALQLRIAAAHGPEFARVDLAWRLPDGTALLVEIDGQDVHAAPEAVYRDRDRQNRLVTPRTIVRRFTGSDAWRGRVAVEVGRVLRGTGWQHDPLPVDTVLRLDP